MQELVYTQDVLRANIHRSGPPRCISNDNAHEMIEVGWNDGGISVYRPVVTMEMADIVHWTSFPAHRSAVLQTMGSYGVGLYSVSAKTFKVHTHGGMEVFSLSAPSKPGAAVSQPTSTAATPQAPIVDDFTGFTTLSTVRFALGTKSGRVYESDMQYGRLVSSAIAGEGLNQEITKICTTERSIVVMGTSSGAVFQWDHRSRRMVNEFKATTGGRILDMDVSGELAVTCGLSSKNSREPFLRVFDLRMQRQLTPIQFISPAGARFVPNPFVSGSASSTLLCVSSNGNLRMSDIRSDGSSDVYGRVQSGAGNIEGIATSCTGRSFSLVDTAGHVHFWATNVSSGWNICDPQVLESQIYPEIEHPQPLETQATSLAHISYWDSDDPCASYASPYVPEGIPLASDFPKSLMDANVKNTKASLRIHPDLLSKVSQRDYVGYVSNTNNLPGMALLFGKEKHGEAYQDVDPRESYTDRAHKGGGGARAPRPTERQRSLSDSSSVDNAEEGGEGNESDGEEEVRRDAREVKRKFARQTTSTIQVNISEQDFSEVNSTQFAGFEVDYDPNAFVNAPLQALYFIPEFRAAVLGLSFSTKPVCIPTETGFLFRLLDKARQLPPKSKACQARNFHRAFRLSPDALALGLLEPSKLPNDRRAGAFTRFVFTQFIAAGGVARECVETLFGVRFTQRDSWDQNGKRQSSTRETSAVVVDVIDDEKAKRFEATLSSTLRQERKHRSWSDQIKAQVNVTTVKTPVSLPPYIVFNCADMFKREEALDDRYFCESFAFVLEKSQVVSMRDPSEEAPPSGAEVYDLVTVVSRITDIDREKQRRKANKARKVKATSTSAGAHAKSMATMSIPEEESQSLDGHLIAHIKLQSDYDQLGEEEQVGKRLSVGSWIMFNDIAVAESSFTEAIDFSSRFRAPAVVIYKKRFDPSALPPPPRPVTVSPEVFLTPSIATLAKKQRGGAAAAASHLIIPQIEPGTLIAIDCEFVALTNDVYEVKPDGTKIVTAPRQLALARVSCLAEDGRVILDDYVASGPEPVADYLTRFSGLVPGDLDPAVSTRHLLPPRVVYLKLLYLIEMGCVFIGHGLENDFKVMNVVIPPAQVRDTVQLWRMKGQRMLSLRFLSSVVLSEDIQDRIHDSIQDARAALRLFLKYREIEAAGKLEETLKRVYLEGPVRNWC